MQAKTLLQQYFQSNFPLNQEGLEEVLEAFAEQVYPKGHRLLQPGQTEREIRFLASGWLREYYNREDKEINIHFFEAPVFVNDFLSLYEAQPSQKWQEALSEIRLLRMSYQTHQELLQKYPCGNQIFEEIFRRLFRQREQREYRRLTSNPEERYQALFQYRPQVLQYVPQYHIASYLGVSPETLSRIRRRIS
ncbi:MAG: Crp/Fnr family transcriptional regulator [Bacteroidota bacterium]